MVGVGAAKTVHDARYVITGLMRLDYYHSIVLAIRASGCISDTQTLEITPQDTQIFLRMSILNI